MERYDSFHCIEGYQLVCIEGPTYTRCVCEQIVGVDAMLPVRDRSLNCWSGFDGRGYGAGEESAVRP